MDSQGVVEFWQHSGSHFEVWRRADLIDRKDAWYTLEKRLDVLYDIKARK